MLDTKVVLVLALLFGAAMTTLKEPPAKPPSGGIPIPTHSTGSGSFQ
jgi:hypothetical protein